MIKPRLTKVSIDSVSVPCGACNLCCKNDAIIVHADLGDDVESYITEESILGPEYRMLAHKDNGDCVYLSDAGCSIHDRRPYKCRIFDCRQLLVNSSRNERRRLIKKGMVNKEILARGRDLRRSI
jgi:Fe-S-cluster containining protein